MQEKCPIGFDDDAGVLHDKLMVLGAKLVVKTLDQIADGTVSTKDQQELIKNPEELKTAPKIFKEDCRINFNKPVDECYNLIRGLSPYPGAFTELVSPEGKKFLLKIFKTKISNQDIPNSLSTDGKKQLQIACEDGSLDILELQLQGKKRMQTQELLRGFKINSDWKINTSIEK